LSRGVVLWPDPKTSAAIAWIWDLLTASGLPSLATHSHRRHVPHISLFVAEDLPVSKALAAVGRVPKEPLKLLIVSAGMFPEGNLVLAAIVTPALQAEQRRVHDLVEPMAFGAWPHFAPGTWTPHITTARSLTPDQVGPAMSVVLPHLPIEGRLDSGGVEDGTTGQHWRPPAA
jgi:2'-5' RNA ligase